MAFDINKFMSGQYAESTSSSSQASPQNASQGRGSGAQGGGFDMKAFMSGNYSTPVPSVQPATPQPVSKYSYAASQLEKLEEEKPKDYTTFTKDQSGGYARLLSMQERDVAAVTADRDAADERVKIANKQYNDAFARGDMNAANAALSERSRALEARNGYDAELKATQQKYRLSKDERESVAAEMEDVAKKLNEYNAKGEANLSYSERANYDRLSSRYNELLKQQENDTRTGVGRFASAIGAGGVGFAGGFTEAGALAGQNMMANQMLADADLRNMSDAEWQALQRQSEAARTDYSSPLYTAADKLAEEQARLHEQSQKGASAIGGVVNDVAENMVQMLGDAAVAKLTVGASLMSMGVRTFGSSAGEARRAGADQGRQVAYGLVKTGIELATEKISDGLAGVYGKGAADDLTERLILKIAGEGNKPAAKLLSIFFSAVGEGGEEAISGLLEPAANAIIEGSSAFDAYTTKEGREGMKDDILYSALIGALCGSLGGVGKVAKTNGTNAEIGSASWAENIRAKQMQDRIRAEARKLGYTDEQIDRLISDALGDKAQADARIEQAQTAAMPQEEHQETTAPEPAPKQLTAEEQTVKTILQDGASNSKAEAILNDPALRAVAEQAIGKPITGTKSEQRTAIKENIDRINAFIDGNIPTAPVANESIANADIANNAEISANESVAPQGDINTPPTTANAQGTQNFPQETQMTDNAEAQNPADIRVINEIDLTQSADADVGPAPTAAADSSSLAATLPYNPKNVNTQSENAETPSAYSPVEARGEETVRGFNENIATDGTEGMKRSQTESNTMQGMSEKVGAEQEKLYYVPITEAQTLMEAGARLSADFPGEMDKLLQTDMWTAADIDTGLTIYGKLQADAAKTGDYSVAQQWAKIVQEHGTKSGQALQAFAKWTRTGGAIATDAADDINGIPDGDMKKLSLPDTVDGKSSPQEQKAQIINDIFGFSTRYDSSVESGSVEDIRQLIKDISDYRRTGTFNAKNFGKILDGIEDVEYLQEFAARQLMSISSDLTDSATLAQKVKTWQVNSQLTRLGTFFRNIGGNVLFGIQDTLTQDAFGVAIDHFVSKKTGVKEVTLDKSWFSSNARNGAKDAMLRSILEVAGDVNMQGNASRYGTTSSRTFKANGDGISRFMSRWEQLLGYSLTTSDRTSRGLIETALTESILEANPGMSEEYARQIAQQSADYRLFQNKGLAVRASKGLHDVANLIGFGGEIDDIRRKGGFGLGDFINAYPDVPANLAMKAFEYSPANIINGSVELAKLFRAINSGEDVAAGTQYKASMDIARGMAGVPIIALLAAFFKSGICKNSDDEEDADVKAMESAEGKTGVQINLSAWKRGNKGESTKWQNGDDLMSIGWAEPLNAFMAIASMIAEEDSDATVRSYSSNYLHGAIQSVLDMPVMQNISNIYDTLQYSTAETAAEKGWEAALGFVGDAVSGLIPAPFSQTAKAMDDTYRSTTADTKFDTVVNGIRQSIPGERQKLDPKLDNFGNEKKYSGTAFQRFMNTFVLPGAINKYTVDEIDTKIADLYESTGDADVYPDRKAPNKLSVGGSKYALSADEKQAYQQTAGRKAAEMLTDLYGSEFFNGLSDAEKAEAIKEAYSYAEYTAKKQYAEANGLEFSDSERSKDVYDSFENPADYLAAKNAWSDLYKDSDEAVTKYLEMFESIDGDAADLMLEKNSELERYYNGYNAGMSVKDIRAIRAQHDLIGKDAELSPTEKATEFKNYLMEYPGLSQKQRDVMLEQNTYASGFVAESTQYDKLTGAGLSSRSAYTVYDAFGALVPKEGNEGVTRDQKLTALAGLDLSVDDKMKALGTIDSAPVEKYRIAMDNGMTFEQFTEFFNYQYSLNQEAGSSSASQGRLAKAIREFGLSYDAANALWHSFFDKNQKDGTVKKTKDYNPRKKY